MTTEISEWTMKHQIEKRTIEGFWINFYSYMEEEPEEFNKVFGRDFESNKLVIQVNNVEMYIESSAEEKVYPSRNYGFDHAISYVPIIYRGLNLGFYKRLFTLDGQSFDDFFIID